MWYIRFLTKDFSAKKGNNNLGFKGSLFRVALYLEYLKIDLCIVHYHLVIFLLSIVFLMFIETHCLLYILKMVIYLLKF